MNVPRTTVSPNAAVEHQRIAVIAGAGPAGLTAAWELLERTDVIPIVLEMSDSIGGLARTVNYKGNRMDIGGHRFFSKSDRVMRWWLDKLPLQRTSDAGQVAALAYQGQSSRLTLDDSGPDPDVTDRVMLLRNRKSRIYFLRRFFDYPIRLSVDTIRKLGFSRMARIGLSYARAAVFSRKSPANLEEFLISRFGKELYLTFFKSYTEKVWGAACTSISAEWGAQRIKGLSITKALTHFFKTALRRNPSDIAQKDIETSLIEQFLYPKYGPGQIWELVAAEVVRRGGQVLLNKRVTSVHVDGSQIQSIAAVDSATGQTAMFTCDFFFSTMPVQELVTAIDGPVPDEVRDVSAGLVYRDFITVGVLVKKLKVTGVAGEPIRDNWIYIQEPDVLLGRLQVFNNWSPYLVADPSTTWLGLEYFCFETDELWQRTDDQMISLAVEELARIGIIESDDVLDATVVRMPKTYPAYFGTYDRFGTIRAYVDQFANLFLIGRNGMHKYNNQDHSMLTAMIAVDNIAAGRSDKSNLWSANTEETYHEEKKLPADT